MNENTAKQSKAKQNKTKLKLKAVFWTSIALIRGWL